MMPGKSDLPVSMELTLEQTRVILLALAGYAQQVAGSHDQVVVNLLIYKMLRSRENQTTVEGPGS